MEARLTHRIHSSPREWCAFSCRAAWIFGVIPVPKLVWTQLWPCWRGADMHQCMAVPACPTQKRDFSAIYTWDFPHMGSTEVGQLWCWGSGKIHYTSRNRFLESPQLCRTGLWCFLSEKTSKEKWSNYASAWPEDVYGISFQDVVIFTLWFCRE